MKKILIVDNTLASTEVVYNILLLEGYQVFQAESGETGIEMALKENPDLIISEVLLPEINGFEMLEKLKKEQRTTNIPLIFLSKKDKKEDFRAGMNSGAEDYLTKPLNANELLNVVKRSIKKQQLNINKIESLIEEKEYLLRETGRMAQIGYWVYDNKTGTRTWSKVVYEIFGTDPKEGAPKHDKILNYFNKESKKQFIKATIDLTENGVLYDMEFQITNLKNEKLWIQDIGEPLYNKKNQIVGHRGVVRDITLLKNDQEALKRSNERFELVALATNDAVWDWDLLTGKIYRSESGFNKLFGFGHNSNRSIKHWDKYVQQEDKKRITRLLKEKTAAVDQHNFSFKYWFSHPDGNAIYVNDKGFIVRDEKGKAIRIIGAASNMTLSKEAEILVNDEKKIMEKIVADEPLKSTLETIALTIEKQIRNSFCSILLLDVDGIHLRHGAAPNLPKDYNLAIDGIAIGENTGIFGIAAYNKESIFVSDIATSPLWKNYKELALNHGLKACWSMPIISKKTDKVLGIFAIYYPTIMMPKSTDTELLKRVSNYIRIAIEKNMATNILINSETKYRNLFERNLAGTYQTTIDGKILRANTTFANILGYESPRKLLEQSADIFYFFESDRKTFVTNLKKEKKLINQEIILKHKNGSKVYLLENCYIQTDSILGEDIIEGVIIDITKRKKFEKSLEESFSNIEAILESTADGILVVDQFGSIVRFNKKFLELWNIPNVVVASMDDNKVLDYVLDQLVNPQKMVAKVEELNTQPEATSSDIIELKDGRVFERYSQQKVINGENFGRVWSFRNITERINADNENQQLVALIETSQEAITFGNMSGIPTYMNKAGRKLLGIDESKSLSKYHFSEMFDSEKLHEIVETFRSAFKANQKWEGDINVLNFKTKKFTPVYMSAFIIRDKITGKAIGLGNVSIDITEREKIKNELIKAKERAEELADFKDQFLANMSHEIRTPLSIIIGFTKILLRNVVTEKQKKQLDAIKTSSDTLLVVINDILDLAKIEAGKMILEKTEITLQDLVKSLLNTFELRLEEKELTLNTQYDKKIPKQLLGDPVRFNQILFNLIDNAIKFSNKGGLIGVTVNLLEEDEKKILLEIIVSDTGIGIAPKNLKTIFSQYTQSNSYTARKHGGSGLGLNIVKQLIDMMNGTIAVKSKLTIGSAFTFTFPLLKSTKKAIEPESNIYNDTKSLPVKKLKILIVDDMQVNQFLAETILQDLGFESDTADNGKIALELLEKNNYDVILMDLQMPKMNGWEVTKYIRNKMPPHKATIPIIALTADITKRDVDMCKEVGMNAYVSKPINETDLHDKILRLTTSINSKISDQNPKVTPICNLNALKNSLHNNPKTIIEMLQMILKETPVVLEEMNRFLIAADWSGLSRKIHSIKPTLQLMGLPKEILVIAEKIEEHAKKEEHLEFVPAQFMKFEKTLTAAFKELEKVLKIIKT